ncbi:MAG: hypothetical protein WD875_15260 [Pirellulales bacterium]
MDVHNGMERERQAKNKANPAKIGGDADARKVPKVIELLDKALMDNAARKFKDPAYQAPERPTEGPSPPAIPRANEVDRNR